MKRIFSLVVIFMLITTACQVSETTEPFVMTPLALSRTDQNWQETAIETSEQTMELYPKVIVDRYPEEGVRGIYLTAYGAANSGIAQAANQVLDQTALNAVVIDYKDDWGRIASEHGSNDSLLISATNPIYPAKELIESYHKAGVYTIARIVSFKDSYRAQAKPELAIQNLDGSVWFSSSGDAYANPFLKENWDYLVAASIEAAKAGFDEIQYDYVRFPENFNYLSQFLKVPTGDYASLEMTEESKRSQAIADFLGYARQKLADYHVRVSADVFGYVAMVVDDGNIGQNFLLMAQNLDVISSMIYPSHWSNGSFGAPLPDRQPGQVVAGYIARELQVLGQLEQPPITRPWLQSFTASYLGSGNYLDYGPAEIQAQIDALRAAGVNEYLLWDPKNAYFLNVNY